MSSVRLETLLSAEKIDVRVRELAAAIDSNFTPETDGPRLWLVAALKGAVFFQADLARAISRETSLGYIRARSYGAGTTSSGDVRIDPLFAEELAGDDVILVEDIVDTGHTATALQAYLRGKNPRTLQLAALLDKPTRREVPVQIDYRGFEIPDEFVVGYGLDYAERCRDLKDICVLHL